MKLSCDIVLKYKDEKTAGIILKSIEIDNFDFINVNKLGNKLSACIETDSIPSLESFMTDELRIKIEHLYRSDLLMVRYLDKLREYIFLDPNLCSTETNR